MVETFFQCLKMVEAGTTSIQHSSFFLILQIIQKHQSDCNKKLDISSSQHHFRENMATITLEAVKLGGERVWGPEVVPADLSCEELRKQLAAELKVRWRAVQLAFGEQRLENGTLGEIPGLEGKQEIQVLLQDRSEEIRKIQEIIASSSKPERGLVKLTEGLSDEEVEALEKRYGFRFPPEFLEFLQAGVLVGGSWHDWHSLASGSIPLGFKGDTVSDIWKWHCTPEDEEYYYENPWAEEKSLDKATEFATKIYPLIPIRGHRCIVSVPHEEGLPVISMHQMSDNLRYGDNFWSWVAGDCDLPEGTVPAEWTEKAFPWEAIPFWQHWSE